MFIEIYNIKVMEDIPRETWEDKFCEVVEYLQRAGVRTEGSEENGGGNDDNREEGGEEEKDPERYLKRMNDKYVRGGLNSWVVDIEMYNLPNVPRNNRDN